MASILSPITSPITSRDGERLDPRSIYRKSDFVSFLKHLKAYDYIKQYAEARTVLELGCGTGYGVKHIAKEFKAITAIDIDSELIDSLKKRNKHSNVQYQNYDGINLPFPDLKFDLVFSFQVIEHVWDDLSFLKEIKRVLAPGGLAILTTPNRNYRLKDNERPFNPFHLREYSPEGIEALVTQVFLDSKVYGVFGTPEIKAIEINRIKSGLGRYDIFNLRRRFPKTISILKRALLHTLKPKELLDTDYSSHYSLSDFSVSNKNLSDSLDLLIELE